MGPPAAETATHAHHHDHHRPINYVPGIIGCIFGNFDKEENNHGENDKHDLLNDCKGQLPVIPPWSEGFHYVPDSPNSVRDRNCSDNSDCCATGEGDEDSASDSGSDNSKRLHQASKRRRRSTLSFSRLGSVAWECSRGRGLSLQLEKRGRDFLKDIHFKTSRKFKNIVLQNQIEQAVKHFHQQHTRQQRITFRGVVWDAPREVSFRALREREKAAAAAAVAAAAASDNQQEHTCTCVRDSPLSMCLPCACVCRAMRDHSPRTSNIFNILAGNNSDCTCAFTCTCTCAGPCSINNIENVSGNISILTFMKHTAQQQQQQGEMSSEIASNCPNLATIFNSNNPNIPQIPKILNSNNTNNPNISTNNSKHPNITNLPEILNSNNPNHPNIPKLPKLLAPNNPHDPNNPNIPSLPKSLNSNNPTNPYVLRSPKIVNPNNPKNPKILNIPKIFNPKNSNSPNHPSKTVVTLMVEWATQDPESCSMR